ncbi:alpha/beta hydrolase [Altibacter sp. HG106]|uniref:alpha/beta hydrolase n=1 Tax=Altibacter sp. HG106 TaxID=3023937 RepID=UPI002350E34B|nr:alpha/beta fold hydrolase [Altibacter sp. HG106]MDC7994844.1 alpha/beta fold hydrolase [Altibacter sp. HG106]
MKNVIPKILGAAISLSTPLFPKWSRERAFDLLCRVKRVPVSEEGRSFLETAHTEVIPSPWIDSTLHRWGSGPKKILFLHGWMSYSYRWKPYIDQLDLTEYTVYALDAPGHGLSEGQSLHIEMYRDATQRALERIGGVDTLVAHSLGSLVTAYARLYQSNLPVARYVIMGAPSGLAAIFDYFQEIVSLSPRALQNLYIKVAAVLKLPREEIHMKGFFEEVTQPVWVVHEASDIITPWAPIHAALPKKKSLRTFITEGQDHNLKAPETREKILQIITTPLTEKETICI